MKKLNEKDDSFKNLFVRGPIRIGKSTHIRNFVNSRTDQIIGMCGQRMVENKMQIVGYQAEFIDFESLPDVDIPYCGQLENIFIYGGKVNEYVLENVIKKIEKALTVKKPSIIVLDETGGFELRNPVIMDALYAILSYDIPCIGTLKGYDSKDGRKNTAFTGRYLEQYQQFSDFIERRGKILDVTQDSLASIDVNLKALFNNYNL